jgi:transposase
LRTYGLEPVSKLGDGMDDDSQGGMDTQRTKRQQVGDDLWEAIAPLIPPEPPKPKGGRPPVPPRKALGGILLVLRTGIGWQELTTEMGFGSGSTCWRRLEAWQTAGVWERLHRILLDRLGDAEKIDWSRASVDGSSVAAKRGANKPGRTRRIAANRARSATLRRIGGASRSR